MNVGELQIHLTNLSRLLRAAAASKAANDLDDLCEQLQPFSDKRLKDLIALMSNAEEIVRSGASPSKRPARTPTDAAPITARVLDLYHRAGQGGVTRDDVDATFADLDRMKLPVAALKAIASQLGISEKLSKAPLQNKMKQTILDRKGSTDRAQT